MIPILYEKTETTFSSNGLGRLSDAIACTVTEERNGIYELEFSYPVGGVHFDDIEIGRIVAVIHDDSKDIQPFDIYRKTEPIDGIVTFAGRHISYRLNEHVTAPYTATTVGDALAGIRSHSYLSNPFTFATDKTTAAAFAITEPTTARAVLGGIDGSILDVYGGEFGFDKFAVMLYNRRGSDTNVQIRYGSNLTEYEDDTDHGDAYNAVIPFWIGMDEDTDADLTVIGSVTNSGQSVASGRTVLVPMDLSGEFEAAPTAAALNSLAASKLASSGAWEPAENLTLNFVPLWQTEEYKDYAQAQRLNLCDTAEIYFAAYNKSARMKVVKVVYNVLTERYDSIEFGELSTSLAEALTASVDEKITRQGNQITTVGRIAGNTAQHFWFNSNGTDTGAHITEVDRETFEADRANGGPNLLARTNGLAVRDGLTELATFSATSAVVGALGTSHIVTSTSGVEVFDDNGVSIAEFGDEIRLGEVSGPHIVESAVSPWTYFDFYGEQSEGVISLAASYDADLSQKTARLYFEAGTSGAPSSYIEFVDAPDRFDSSANTALSVRLGTPDGGESFAVKLNAHKQIINSTRRCNVLWAGTPTLLQSGQSVTFAIDDDHSQIMDQLSGVVLVWSRWANSTAYNDSWWYVFIPKWHVLTHNGGGVYMSTPTGGNTATVCNKYVYVYNDHLEGYQHNNATGTGYANNTRVLRAVLGV